MSIIRSLAFKIGMDKAIAYSSGARIVQGIAGFGSMFFISTFLTGVEQGFYFTFGSILALQVFFELGLTGIMTQYVAHEASHLSIDENFEYQGENTFKSRLASLLRFCVKWYSILAIIALFFLMIAGFSYFSKYGDSQSSDTEWRMPWILICIATAIQLFVSPLTSIISGLGFVKTTSKIIFFQQLFVPLCTWIGLAVGLKLYVTGIGHLFSVLFWFFFVLKTDLYKVLYNLLKIKIDEKVNYIREIFPFQWKIALSWISGYFIFQLFNPVLFATEGAVVAGQMGMTLQVLNAISAFSMSWLNTKVPTYSRLIALRKYDDLDRLFNLTLKQMSMICLVLLLMFFIMIWGLNVTQFEIGKGVLADRFLSYGPLLLIMVPVFLTQFINSWATYLRCHKQEPFLLNSVVVGLLCLFSTFVMGDLYGLYGVTIGYFCIKLFTFPWGYKIYKTKKNEWHGYNK